ncbi:glycosyl transferase family 1 [Silicimonas algicola]|uniref:Glycosyl transferase family 1 n=2 Tax=Silicimonas algicola TaxID=1826607 RepID=A0A316GD41_9RHOB|nr:glycosyl transferase family 1 [Silicimonas algicola]
MRVAILDPNAPRPYTTDPASLIGLGGTEMTIADVAHGLARDVRLEIHQAARTASSCISGVWFTPYAWKAKVRAETIVVINSWKAAVACRKVNPDARMLLWLHNVPGRHNRRMGEALREADVTIVCVSASHARSLRAFLGRSAPKITHVYNPIPDDLRPLGLSHDPDLLFFASAPHKGLCEVFQNFRAVRDAFPTMTLAVADPAYMRWDCGPVPDGVRMVGRQDKARLWEVMERSLCLFCPQTTFAETFGIVLAEANAVGCPVLTHGGLGANDEVVSSRQQCIDCTDMDAMIATIGRWRESRPKVSGRSDFRLSSVLEDWRTLLQIDDKPSPRLHESSRRGSMPVYLGAAE